MPITTTTNGNKRTWTHPYPFLGCFCMVPQQIYLLFLVLRLLQLRPGMKVPSDDDDALSKQLN